MSIKQDVLYARAWEGENERSFFDTDYDNTTTPGSQKNAVQSEWAADEMRNTSGTPQEGFAETCPLTVGLSFGSDTYSHLDPDVETSSEQPNPTPNNPRSRKYSLRHIPKPDCNADYR